MSPKAAEAPVLDGFIQHTETERVLDSRKIRTRAKREVAQLQTLLASLLDDGSH